MKTQIRSRLAAKKAILIPLIGFVIAVLPMLDCGGTYVSPVAGPQMDFTTGHK